MFEGQLVLDDYILDPVVFDAFNTTLVHPKVMRVRERELRIIASHSGSTWTEMDDSEATRQQQLSKSHKTRRKAYRTMRDKIQKMFKDMGGL